MDKLLDVASLVVFAFGAVAFSILTVFYWGERLRRKTPRKPTVFPEFTLVCAAAFVNSLFFHAAIVDDLTSGLLPPLMLHLVFEGGRRWRWTLIAMYGAGIASALARGLFENDLLDLAPAVMLAAASTTGLLLQAFARRPLKAGERAHRRWIGALLALMLVCAAANLAGFGALAGPLPDYLLLTFFCVTLYYRERLVFFDLLVKRGVFFAVGLAAVVRLPWSYATVTLALWFVAPWVYAFVERAVDRAWLRRPYSAQDAERQFIRDIQSATTEDELRSTAAASLGGIFQTAAEVAFDASAVAADDGLAEGSIRLAPRPDGIPFLSDDRRLLQSLAGALGVVRENVRFREREQRLRWLASRAELKALRAQINPHFLFNALSVIAGLVHYQPELADETIEQLAQVFRYTLRKSENEWAPLAEEVDFVSSYLRIEKARFGERLQFHCDVDPAAARLLIPAMSIQPLIENAIKHGVSAVEGCGTVTLRAALEDGLLSVEVMDNGPGFPTGFSLEERGDGH